MLIAPLPAANAGPRHEPVTVLVIDDQRAVREGVARLISCAGMPVGQVRTAGSAAEALLVARQCHPEVVVLDVDLDGDDGLALLPELARAASVLVLTSHGDKTTRARALHLGAQCFVEKHQPAAELLAGVADLVRRVGEGQTSWTTRDNCPAADGRILRGPQNGG